MTQKGQQSILISLGISAIDVLCCAMIASFVLFLVLSSRARDQNRGTKGELARCMQIRIEEKESDPTAVLNLVLEPPLSSGPAEIPSSLWTDEGSSGSEIQHWQAARPGLQQDGHWKWLVFSPRLSMLILEKPVSGDWHASLGYAHGMSGSELRVAVQCDGACEYNCEISLRPGETKSLGSVSHGPCPPTVAVDDAR